jgi:transcriptional regulator with XRE-family HTH domain
MTVIDLGAISVVRRAAKDGTARRVRRAAGVSLGEVARACGVEPQTVLRWESGQRSPRARAAERYATALAALLATLDGQDGAFRELREALERAG